MHHTWPSRAEPFLPGKAPADDRIQKGEANHSGSTKVGQMSAATRTTSLYFPPASNGVNDSNQNLCDHHHSRLGRVCVACLTYRSGSSGHRTSGLRERAEAPEKLGEEHVGTLQDAQD